MCDVYGWIVVLSYARGPAVLTHGRARKLSQ